MFKRSYISGHAGTQPYIPTKVVVSLKNIPTTVAKNTDALVVFKAFSDTTKLSVFLLLRSVEELPVSDIATILELPQPTVSHALAQLKRLDIVTFRRCGQLRCYAVQKQSIERQRVLEAVAEVFKY